jgi:hypothetical protein
MASHHSPYAICYTPFAIRQMSTPPLFPPPPPESLEPRAGYAGTPARPSRLALLWRDHTLQLLFLLALFVNGVLVGYLILRFDMLPDLLPLHFDASGQADRIEAKTGIFGLPLLGFSILLVNFLTGILLHSRERAATILLATTALLLQVLLWFAVSSIIGGLV